MMRGLMLGGLIGLLLGHGFGGLAGMFGFLLQALLIGGAIWLAIRLFRSQPARSPEPAMAGGSGGISLIGMRRHAKRKRSLLPHSEHRFGFGASPQPVRARTLAWLRAISTLSSAC